jgi:acetyl-CoA acetyltransferase
MEKNIKGKVAIVGIGETKIGKHPGKNSDQLAAEASIKAIEEAGLSKDDIDGVLTAGSFEGAYSTQSAHSAIFAEYMQIHPRHTAMMRLGGATPAAMVEHAALAIDAGLCNTVLIAAGDNRISGLSRQKTMEIMSSVGHPEFEDPYGPLIPALYALVARRHMYEFGTTSEQLAAIAVAMRKHASLNENAVSRKPLTVEEVISSPMIARPLHKFDCCFMSDGGGAVIVTASERAKDLRKKPIFLLGAGEGSTHEHISQSPSLTTFGCKLSGENAFRMEGVKPQDIGVAELYDCFTITVLIELEDLGFCKKGEGGAFVEGGRIEVGGQLPVNTHGGLLSQSQVGRASSLFHVMEAVRQLRGEAGERQIPGVKFALAHGNGGILSTHCTLILGREER